MQKNNKLDGNNLPKGDALSLPTSASLNLPKGDALSLPKGWEMKKLGQLCEVIAGQSPQSKYYNNNGKGLPFYQGKKEFTNKFIGAPTKWTTKITKEAIKDDILISVRAPVGPVNFSTQKICIGRGLAAIRASKRICIEFLFFFLLKHENEIIGNSGAVFNSLNKTQIGAIEIPLPPLPEQQRIVGKLDALFAGIEALETNTKQNLENAKELFQSYLQAVFDPSTHRDDDCGTLSSSKWEEKKLGEVCGFQNGFAFKSATFKDTGTPVVRITNIKNERIDLSNIVYINRSDYSKNLERFEIVKGDILIAMSGATTGKIGIYDSDKLSLLNQRVGKFSPREELNKSYLFRYLATKAEESLAIAAGAAQPNLSTKQIKDFHIPLPPLSEQQRIVAKLDALSTETKKLESIYQEKLLFLSELKKSILDRAFKGKLL